MGVLDFTCVSTRGKESEGRAAGREALETSRGRGAERESRGGSGVRAGT